MKFDPFIIPFTTGFFIMISILIVQYVQWIRSLDKQELNLIRKGIFSFKIFGVIKEIILECLLHLKIFKQNILLGYMHMSFAFGWFLLIVVGATEVRLYNQDNIMFYEAIFLKYFYTQSIGTQTEAIYHFVMDFLLLFILVGLFLALLKRFYAKIYGIKKSSTQLNYDRFALTMLWLIFPLRLIAESSTAAIYDNGGFLTGTIGNWLAYKDLGTENIMYAAWWSYSIDLGAFFIILPFSRYMHIPTEIILVALRRFGIETKGKYSGYSEFEVNACSNCGICTNQCQLNIVLNKKETVFPYFARAIRNKKVKEEQTYNCLLCGRCKSLCPVQINTNAIRESKREAFIEKDDEAYNYIQTDALISSKAKVAYFAGCMTHLTPGIKKAMLTIFRESKTEFTLIDQEDSICCGRPLKIAGNTEQANQLVEKNRQLIDASGAEILVLSCPICYKAFKEDYDLQITIMHHTEFLNQLIDKGKINVFQTTKSFSYHDPCELGRGSKIINEPRQLIQKVGVLLNSETSAKENLCCGNSLGDLILKHEERAAITKSTITTLSIQNPDNIITGCPLCKKTFSAQSDIVIKDIAEIVAENIIKEELLN